MTPLNYPAEGNEFFARVVVSTRAFGSVPRARPPILSPYCQLYWFWGLSKGRSHTRTHPHTYWFDGPKVCKTIEQAVWIHSQQTVGPDIICNGKTW